MHPEDPRAEHFREEKERQFVRLLIIYTVRDALDLYTWYHTGTYHNRFLYRLGFTRNAPKDKAFKRTADEIKTWIESDQFDRLCKRIGFDPANTRSIITGALAGNDHDRIRELLKEYDEELSLYAFHGPKSQAEVAEYEAAKQRDRIRFARPAGLPGARIGRKPARGSKPVPREKRGRSRPGSGRSRKNPKR